MLVSYRYVGKDGQSVSLSQVNDEMNKYRQDAGATEVIELLESMMSKAGLELLIHTGGCTLTGKQIRDVCTKWEVEKAMIPFFIEFFVTRYTFEACR